MSERTYTEMRCDHPGCETVRRRREPFDGRRAELLAIIAGWRVEERPMGWRHYCPEHADQVTPSVGPYSRGEVPAWAQRLTELLLEQIAADGAEKKWIAVHLPRQSGAFWLNDEDR